MLNVILLCLFNINAFSAPDTSKAPVTVTRIELDGNKKTRSSILYRELTFKEGDTLDRNQLPRILERSRLNLLNTLLFTFVTAESHYTDSTHVTVKFTVNEAWYTWPMPIFELVERNFNEWWRKKDLSRTNYGLYIVQQNCRGRNETLNLGFRAGYTQSVDFQYSIPYINKKQDAGLAFGISYSRNHEIAYNTIDNRLLFLKDNESFTRKQFNTFFRYSYRKGFYTTHNINIGFRNFAVSDTVIQLNPDYFTQNTTDVSYPYLSYYIRHDRRDLKAYPLEGYYIDGEVQKAGLGALKSSLDAWFAIVNLKKYWKLSERWHYAAGLTNKFSIVDKQAYFNQVSLGYDDYIRGYEYYVINGNYYGLLQTNFKYTLMKTKVLHVKAIPLEKFRTIPNTFYINLFADAGYVNDRRFNRFNPLSNSLQYAYGIGLDYFTYYSMVFRIDYSINKFGENGFFIHFTIPI